MSYKEIQKAAKNVGLHCGTWSPGDGTTRYRFFAGPTAKENSYFGPGHGIYTALGAKEASTFIAGFALGLGYRRDGYLCLCDQD